MFLADPSDVALRASSDDPVLHTMRNPLRGISEQVAGLSDPRNHVFRGIYPELLDRPDSSEHLWSAASLDQRSRRYD